MSKLQIIVDTDPGVDDSLALAYMAAAKLPVTALTTVFGNAPISEVTRNAAYIVKSLEKEWDIHAGAELPLAGKPRCAESQGATGLGGVDANTAARARTSEQPAADFLKNALSGDSPMTLFSLGPATNLATALSQIKQQPSIQQLVIMGGVFGEKGNVSEFAEFNVYNDPVAFKQLLEIVTEHRIETVIIPANMCRKVTLTRANLEALKKNCVLAQLAAIVEPYIDYYLNDEEFGGFDGAVLYDVLVPIFFSHPEFFTLVPATITVNTDAGERYGQLSQHTSSTSSVKLCTNIDAQAVKELFMSALVSNRK